MGIVCGNADFRGYRFCRPRIWFLALADQLFIKKKSEKRDQTDISTSPHVAPARLNGYTKEFFLFRTSSSFVFSLQLLKTIFDKQLRRYNSLTNPSPDEERDRSRDVCRSTDEEKGDLDDEIDVELDGNDQLDLESRSRLRAQ